MNNEKEKILKLLNEYNIIFGMKHVYDNTTIQLFENVLNHFIINWFNDKNILNINNLTLDYFDMIRIEYKRKYKPLKGNSIIFNGINSLDKLFKCNNNYKKVMNNLIKNRKYKIYFYIRHEKKIKE